jgi:hypothetical protein
MSTESDLIAADDAERHNTCPFCGGYATRFRYSPNRCDRCYLPVVFWHPWREMHMRPIDQTIFVGDTQPGNCFAACIASIFEIPIESIPAWETDAQWPDHWIQVSDYLAEAFGVGMLKIDFASGTGGLVHDDDCFCILTGEGPRGVDHAVVGLGPNIVHDPHPSRDGLVGKPKSVIYFVVLHPQCRQTS